MLVILTLCYDTISYLKSQILVANHQIKYQTASKQTSVVLGSGGYGHVKLSPCGNYALKSIKKTELKSIDRETRALKYDHPNIVKVFDVEINEECYVIKMEYCQRGSLRSVIDNPHLVYNWKTVLSWAEELTAGLAYLEGFDSGRGLAHRDIKPDNILLTACYTLKIGDFGSNRCLDSKGSMTNFVGTFRYMSPEIFEKSQNGMTLSLSSKIDIYGAGLVLWEIIERSRVFFEYQINKENYPEIFEHLKMGSYHLVPPYCKHELAYLVESCTRYDASYRPETLQQVYTIVQTLNRDFLSTPHSEMITRDFQVNGQEVRVIEDSSLGDRSKPIGFDGGMNRVPGKYDQYQKDLSAFIPILSVHLSTSNSSTNSNESTMQKNPTSKAARTQEIVYYVDTLLEYGDRWPEIPRFGFLIDHFVDKTLAEILESHFIYLNQTDKQFHSLVENLNHYFCLPEKYIFDVDELPEFPRFNEFEQPVIDVIVEQNVIERSIVELAFYLKLQHLVLPGKFKELRDIFQKFFLGQIDARSPEFSIIYKRIGNQDLSPIYTSIKLRLYVENPSNSCWILLSRKRKLFLCFGSQKEEVLAGDFNDGDEEFHWTQHDEQNQPCTVLLEKIEIEVDESCLFNPLGNLIPQNLSLTATITLC